MFPLTDEIQLGINAPFSSYDQSIDHILKVYNQYTINFQLTDKSLGLLCFRICRHYDTIMTTFSGCTCLASFVAV